MLAIDPDIELLSAELEQLSAFSDAVPPAVTRIVYTPADLRARAWFTNKARAAGLRVREDAMGNTFARWEGSEPGLPAVGTGSHIDAIPQSGRYDGTVGVLGGLEAIRALQRAGFAPHRSIEVLLFTSEEPTRFAMGCTGSRLLSGVYEAAVIGALKDADGKSLDEVRQEAGFTGELGSVLLPDDYYHCFVELHIEQGPVLERESIDIGAVNAIAAPATVRAVYHGEGGHAGAVLMPQRRDALLGAAQLALRVREAARATGRPDTVATTGVLKVFPAAVNSIPSRCALEIDIRDTDQTARDTVVRTVEEAAVRIGAQENLRLDFDVLNADPPAICDLKLVESIEKSAGQAGASCRRMVSRAYHDSLFMAAKFPTAMIFIPCRAGISHRPDEYASPSAIRKGVAVLAHTLAQQSEDV